MINFILTIQQSNQSNRLIIVSEIANNNENQNDNTLLKFIITKMQKFRARSQAKLYDKDLLPSLKTNSTSFVGRTIIPISKFDLDSNFVLKEQTRFKMMSVIETSQNAQKPKIKSKKNFIQSFFPLQNGFKLISSDSKRQISHDNYEDQLQRYASKNLVNIDLSKTSSKSYGLIKGYAANSHPGLCNSTNQDRICIVTNLNKTSVKPKQVSFFSIYDGTNGLLKADYFRDNFHLVLNSNQDLLTDPQKAIKSTIQKIQKTISSNSMYLQDSSKVGYVILVSVEDIAYVVVCGTCRATISRNFGQQIEKINLLNHQKNISKHQNTKKHYIQKDQAINVFVKKVNLQSQIDFILLGTEGLFENLNEERICKKLWSQIIRSKHQNIHTVLGQTTLSLLYSVFALSNTKNASQIMLGLKNIQSCLKKNQKLNLPYLDD